MGTASEQGRRSVIGEAPGEETGPWGFKTAIRKDNLSNAVQLRGSLKDRAHSRDVTE
jgi:hypothetical protein